MIVSNILLYTLEYNSMIVVCTIVYSGRLEQRATARGGRPWPPFDDTTTTTTTTITTTTITTTTTNNNNDTDNDNTNYGYNA